MVFNPSGDTRPPRARISPAPPPPEPKPEAASAASADAKPKFSKQRVAGRLRQLKNLFDDWLLTEAFYDKKVAECEAGR